MLNNNFFKEGALHSALAKTTACCLALFLAIALRTEHPFWALISAFVIPYGNIGSTLTGAFKRVAATIIGVGIGMLVIALFASYKIIFIIVIFTVITILMNFHYKYNSYIFLMSSITFVLLTITVFISPNKIISTAFFRCLEISIGVFADTIVTILLFPNFVSKKIKKMEQDAIIQFFDLAVLGFKKSKDFLDKEKIFLEELNKLIKARTEAKIEKIIPWQRNNKSFDLEKEIMLVTKLIENYYSSKYKAIDLKEILDEAKALCLDLIQDKIPLHMYNEKILLIAEKIEERKIKFIFKAFYISIESDSSLNASSNSSNISKYLEVINLKQAIKTALSVLCLPFIWIVFNLPGLGQVGISAVILMKLDEKNSASTAWKRIVGCIAGVLIGLAIIGLGISNFNYYIIIFAITTFIIAFLFYNDSENSYIYLQTFVAMAVTILTGENPVTTLSSGFQRASGILLGIISTTVINNLLWPISTNKLFRIQIAELQEKLFTIVKAIKEDEKNLQTKDFLEFHQEIIKIKKLKFNEEIKEDIYQAFQKICNNLYVIKINIELLNEEQKKHLPSVLEILNNSLAEVSIENESIPIWSPEILQAFPDLSYNVKTLINNLVKIDNNLTCKSKITFSLGF